MGAIIKNGVVYGGSVTQQQSNWTESDTTSLSYIQNKPTLGTASSKDSTTTISDGGTDLPTAGAVYTALQNVHIDVDTTLDTTSNNPIANSAVATALNGKVDAVNGKGLSTNDYTDADQSKLSNIAAGAEVNVQSNWSETDNSSDAYIQNKPTALSAFTNDSGFITNTVNNLTNYYTTSTTYTKTEVDNLISAAKNGRFEVVAILPTTDIQTNVIYLLPKTVSQTDNVYDEYINTDGTSAGWEKIGDTQIDLSNYVQKSSTTGLIKNDGTIDTNTYIQTSSTSGLVKNDGTIDTNSYATASSLSDYIQKSNTSGLVKNDGTIDTNTYATSSSLSDYIAKSQTTGLIKNDGTVDTNSYALASALPGTASTSTAGLVKIDGDTITIDQNGVISSSGDDNILSKTRYTITATNWSNSVDANGYYTYTLTLNPTLSMDYAPNVDIAGANNSTFSTDEEKEAYDLLDECNLTAENTLVLYAKTKPTVNFYIWVENKASGSGGDNLIPLKNIANRVRLANGWPAVTFSIGTRTTSGDINVAFDYNTSVPYQNYKVQFTLPVDACLFLYVLNAGTSSSKGQLRFLVDNAIVNDEIGIDLSTQYSGIRTFMLNVGAGQVVTIYSNDDVQFKLWSDSYYIPI